MNTQREDFKFRALTTEDWKDLNPDQGLVTDEKGRLMLDDNRTLATYYSPKLDSGIPGCTWHRLVLEANIPKGSTLTLQFATSNEEYNPEQWWGKVMFKQGTAKDALLYLNKPQEGKDTAPGRYIWLRIDFKREKKEDQGPVLSQVKIYYPRLTYLRYLPAFYQKNTQTRQFLERYLSLFESILYDSETTIANITAYLDPMAAPGNFLPWLALWVSLDWYQQIEHKNREFILRAVEFYQQKGTPAGLVNLVSFLTGQPCCIKEYFNNVLRTRGMEHIKNNEAKAQVGAGCKSLHRTTSCTADTADKDLLSNIGTYYDEVHYVTDTRPNARYSRHSIGVFIFLPFKESQLNPARQDLLRILQPFLPVFVQAEIITVKGCYHETYDLSTISDPYKDIIYWVHEVFSRVQGKYRDTANWDQIITPRGKQYKCTTNSLDYRTVSDALLGKQKPSGIF